MNTAIGQLMAGVCFFGVWSCEYYINPKGEDKCTRILQKGGIHIYRKHRELFRKSGILHLADKVSPTFLTQKNRGQKCHSDTMADDHKPLPGAHLDRNHHPIGLILSNNK